MCHRYRCRSTIPGNADPDITKARKLLNWGPTMKVAEGPAKTNEYFRGKA